MSRSVSARSGLACLTATMLSTSPSSASASGDRLMTQRPGDVVDDHRQARWRRRWRGSAPARRAPAACCSTATTASTASTPQASAARVSSTLWRVSLEPVPATTGARPPTAATTVRNMAELLVVAQRRRLAGGAGDDEPVRAVGEQERRRARRGARDRRPQVGVEGRHHRGEDGPEARRVTSLPLTCVLVRPGRSSVQQVLEADDGARARRRRGAAPAGRRP